MAATGASEIVIARGKDPVTLRPDDSIEHACDLMAQHQVRRLPVVEDGVSPEQAGRMLTSISKG